MTADTTQSKKKTELLEAKQDLEKQKVKDTVDRYNFLLGQTSLFSHFIKSKGLMPSDNAGKKAESGGDSRGKGKKDANARRGRKTEKEEDEELLQDEIAEEDSSKPNGAVAAETVFTSSPAYIKNGQMRDYQVQGLNWMISLFEHGINGILADEMGLGKTCQTISFLGYLKHFRNTPGPNLVLVPKSTLQNWVNEFNRWIPDFKVFLFHGSKEERQQMINNELFGNGWEVMVTSYETCLSEKAQLRKFAWQYIVIDEAHRIKNENSLLSQIVRTFTCRNRLLITGTPLQNNLRELWALLNFLLPDIFTTYEEFDEYLQSSDKNDDQDDVVKQLHAVLRPFLLRRLKADVEKSLLPKKKINLYVGMSEMQKQWYQKILSKDVEGVNGAVKDSREGKTRLLNIVMQLRKCCNHPYLFDGAEPGPPFTTDQHLIDNAGKLALLDKLLVAMKAKGSRVLIFSQMSRMLDILEDYCIWKEYDYCRLDGQTAHEDRIRDIDEFNKPNSKKFIFLLTTRAGGLGINLATADTVVMYDSDWNPQVDLQAEDRAHRIGQKKQVYIFRFVTENAIEEKVIERAASKLRLDQLVIQQGRVANQNKTLSKNELVSMIQHGADKILNSSGSSIQLDESIDDIIKKGEERTAQLDKKFLQLGLDDLQNFSLEAGSMYEFEGKDFSNTNQQKSKDTSAVGFGWIAPARRERKTAGYSIDEYYRQQMHANSKGAEAKVPRPPKQIFIQDHQFYPQRLVELQKRELYAYWKEVNYKVPVSDPPTEEELEEQRKVDESVPLTEQEKEEMDHLRSHGFSNWLKRDFWAFVRGCEKFGRNNFEGIASEVETKSVDEVREYAAQFWEKYYDISDYETIMDRINRGEEKIRKRDQIQETLSNIVAQYKFPLQQLYINYGQTTKARSFSEEEDRFLIVGLQKYGYNTDDVYELIRRDIRAHPAFRFDWFIKSRTSTELSRRCNTLINLLMKDMNQNYGNNVEDENSEAVSGKRKSTNAASLNGSQNSITALNGDSNSQQQKKVKKVKT
ncbi:hypothetical protein MIR68_010406 [Amoeboaphelidium protococcarum]|nr:hypothetical protein MIR68_010406 [Amoeboaphelidium protococcarum]